MEYLVGFYSLFSVTEEPFVTSGGTYPIYLLQTEEASLITSSRSVDGILLERQKGSSKLAW